MVGLTELLAAYPFEAVESVLSPLSGIPAKYKFLPAISEVREELEARMERVQSRAVFDRSNALPAPPEPPRPTDAEMLVKYGPNYGLDQRPPKLGPWLTKAQIMKEQGLTQEDWDAIPEAPDPEGFLRLRSTRAAENLK